MEYKNLSDYRQLIKKAIAWAGKCEAVWIEDSELGFVREAGKPWIELEDVTLTEISSFEESEESEDETAENPREVYQVAQKTLRVKVRGRSRIQAQTNPTLRNGFDVLGDVQSRLQMPYTKDAFLIYDISLGDIGIVRNMPILEFDDRMESQALMEVDFHIVIIDTDPASDGTFIESMDLTSDIEGVSEDLQIDGEIIPEPEE